METEIKRPTISTHILDTTNGHPAINVPVTLYHLEDDEWKLIKQSITNADGRCSSLIDNENFKEGYYKIHFDVMKYFKDINITKFLYPFIEIAFQCEQEQNYHIPLLLNPFGYSTYRGS